MQPREDDVLSVDSDSLKMLSFEPKISVDFVNRNVEKVSCGHK